MAIPTLAVLLVASFPTGSALRLFEKVARPCPRPRPRGGLVAASGSHSPLFTFDSAETLAEWERIDDVIMGGVSSSRLVLDEGSALFKGTLRVEGGGFCGTRLRLLEQPLDLSAAAGLSLDCCAGPDAEKRVWKLTCRTRQDRGEEVYQATFYPQTGVRATAKLPWSDFRLVRASSAGDSTVLRSTRVAR